MATKKDEEWIAAVMQVGYLPTKGTNALDHLLEMLRSGEAVSWQAAWALAELIDGKDGLFRNVLTLRQKPKPKKGTKVRGRARRMSVAQRVLKLSERMTTSDAVMKVSEKLHVDERTVYRWLKDYTSAFDKIPIALDD